MHDLILRHAKLWAQPAAERKRAGVRRRAGWGFLYWRKAYPAGEITKEKIIDQFQGWDAHAAHGDTYALRQKYAGQVGEIIGEVPEIHRKINSTKEVRARRRAKQERCIRKKTGAPVSFALPALEGPRPDDIPPW